MGTPFQEWLEDQLIEADSVRAFSRSAGIDDSTILSWRDRHFLPNPDHERKLVKAGLIGAEALQKLVADSRLARWEQRQQAKAERAERAAKKPLAKAAPGSGSPYNSALPRPPKRAARDLAFASA